MNGGGGYMCCPNKWIEMKNKIKLCHDYRQEKIKDVLLYLLLLPLKQYILYTLIIAAHIAHNHNVMYLIKSI